MNRNKSGTGNADLSSASQPLWMVLFLCWLVLGVLSAGAPFIQFPQVRSPLPPSAPAALLWRMFATQWLIWLAWAAFVPVVLWLLWAFPISIFGWGLPVHLVACAVLCVKHTVMSLWLTWLIQESGAAVPRPPLLVRLGYSWTRDLPFCALFYGLTLGVSSALDYYRQFRERELRA